MFFLLFLYFFQCGGVFLSSLSFLSYVLSMFLVQFFNISYNKVVLVTFERNVETENQLLTVVKIPFACTGTLKMIYLPKIFSLSCSLVSFCDCICIYACICICVCVCICICICSCIAVIFICIFVFAHSMSQTARAARS